MDKSKTVAVGIRRSRFLADRLFAYVSIIPKYRLPRAFRAFRSVCAAHGFLCRVLPCGCRCVLSAEVVLYFFIIQEELS
ncbi:MAG: hypothetical protein IJC45_07325 [Clostridia bacterium]|nr:hypothetical protein [Clostridia bacterium]